MRNKLTTVANLVNQSRVGRKKLWSEDMQARFPEGTFERIAAVLEEDEDRTDFIRAAVEALLKKRERRLVEIEKGK